MSRIGKQPVILPEKTEAKIADDGTVTVKGPKGELSRTINPVVHVSIESLDEGDALVASVENEQHKYARAQWGTARSILESMVKGVNEGFSKELEVNGVGYRVQLSGKTLKLSVGYSHDIDFALPEGIEASVEDNRITISGSDKQLVGHTAAQIRSVRKPEPYKGKGIKYVDEVIQRKVGKAAQAAAE